MATPENTHHHFLVVAIAAQGQINPARHLARRLARTAGARVTIAIPISSHRRMFPSSAGDHEVIDEQEQGLISYASYSDGYDDGSFHPHTGDWNHFMSQLKLIGTRTLTDLARTLAGRGRPVTCVIYTILLAWAADVARDLAVPSVLFWIQPAAVLTIYYHYFNGASDLILTHNSDPLFTFNLPGLPPLQIKDLPSMLTAPSPFLDSHREIFQALEKERERSAGIKPRVLMNTFHALEADAISAIDDLNLISIGPMVEKDVIETAVGKDLYEHDKSDYMEWLDAKEERSVVYISFGSLSRLSKSLMEEISRGLAESGRPYLWVVRRDNREKGGGIELEGGDKGMIVEWCNQVRVLSHRSIGCFVTHCGWNSTIESILCGVPMVMLPQWMDQATNARLVEGVWGKGVRGEVNGEGVMEGRELKRCLDVVMGEGERGAEIRRRSKMWRDEARKAVGEDGSSVRSLMAFVEEL